LKGRVSVAEIAQATGRSVQAVHKQATKQAWPFEIENGRGSETENGRGRPRKEYLVASLPEEIRMELAVPQVKEKMNQVTLYNSERTPVGSPNLSTWQNRIALARVDLIRAYLNEKKRAKKAGESVTKAGSLFIAGYNTGQLLPRVFEALGQVSQPTVERLAKQWRDAGFDYAALSTQWGNRKGHRKLIDEEWNILLSFALHPHRLRIAECARLTRIKLSKNGTPLQASEATLMRALKDWKKTNDDKWVFCRRGEKALNDNCLPYLERDIGLLDVGEVVVADGHVLNFEIMHPFTGKPARMMMVMWYDWASAMPVGWEIMPTENVQCIAAGLRRAIITLGKVPKLAYLDNGKAFKSKIFNDETIDFEEAGFYGMFARLGMDTIFAWPYNAQSKPVERFFGTFSELERLMPTYTGTDIAHKPARLLRNEKLHRKIHEQKYGGWVPTIDQANLIIAQWVTEYAQRPHGGLKGLRPIDVIEAGRGPGVDEKELHHLMMAREIKTIHRNGISFMGRHYYNDALYGLRDRVLIKYDFEDLTNILVYDHTGAKEICKAAALNLVHPVAKLTGKKEDMAAVKEGIKNKRSLKKQTEAAARAYVEQAPALIEIPGGMTAPTAAPAANKTRTIARIPRAVAEKIEADAAKMQVVDLKPKTEPIFDSEAERYEYYMEMEYGSSELTIDQMSWMRYFETTQEYGKFKDRFDFFREILIAGPEEQEAK
jgi:putative transposase